MHCQVTSDKKELFCSPETMALPQLVHDLWLRTVSYLLVWCVAIHAERSRYFSGAKTSSWEILFATDRY